MKPVLFFAALVAAAPLAAAEATPVEAKAPVEVARTASLPLSAGGTVRIDRTWGEISVEAWDEPTVQVVATAASKREYAASEAAEVRTRLERFGFDAKAASATEVAVTGVSPDASLLKPLGGKSGVKLRYVVKVPRDSRLVLDHSVGIVNVEGVAGDVAVANDTGEVVLKLPLTADVAVDASTRVGEVEVGGELAGRGDFKRRAIVGHHFGYRPAAPERNVTVRVGVGTITLS